MWWFILMTHCWLFFYCLFLLKSNLIWWQLSYIMGKSSCFTLIILPLCAWHQVNISLPVNAFSPHCGSLGNSVNELSNYLSSLTYLEHKAHCLYSALWKLNRCLTCMILTACELLTKMIFDAQFLILTSSSAYSHWKKRSLCNCSAKHLPDEWNPNCTGQVLCVK